jgi:FkbM family methyltransferase
MPSMRSIAKGLTLTVADGLGRTPVGAWLTEWGRTGPVALKSNPASRLMSRIASVRKPATDFVETNLGIARGLRVLVPSGKHQLQFGRPEQDLAERATLELTKILARQARAFIDVGGNEGIFAFSVACDAKRRADVHVFEPDPELFKRLSANVRRNSLDCTVKNIAVGDRVGRQTFHRNLSSDLSGSLTGYFKGVHETAAIEVEVTTLAHYLEANSISDACVKVDVEGAGAAVWTGAKGARDRIAWLVMEIIGPEIEARLPRRIMDDTGWHAYYIRDFQLVPSRDGTFEYRAPFYNWLFCSKGAAEVAHVLKGRFRVLPPHTTGSPT